MCRLLAIYGKIDIWKEILVEFRKLAEFGKIPPIVHEPGHRDGWGMAGSNNAGSTMVEIARSVEAADRCALYQKILQSLKNPPHILLCHLRKASPGVPIAIENVHPFFHSGWAFAHNGTLYNPEALPRNSSFKLTSKGSDSEYLFHFLLSLCSHKEKDIGVLKNVSGALSSLQIEYTALNCILCDGKELYIIRDHNQFANYYTLYYYIYQRNVIVSSEKLHLPFLDREKWYEIPNKSILRIRGEVPDIDFISIK